MTWSARSSGATPGFSPRLCANCRQPRPALMRCSWITRRDGRLPGDFMIRTARWLSAFVQPNRAETLNEHWAERSLTRALAAAAGVFDEHTTGFRLFNGEGDGLPGLICDVYGDTAVIQLDGAGPAASGTRPSIARVGGSGSLAALCNERSRSEGKSPATPLVGESAHNSRRFCRKRGTFYGGCGARAKNRLLPRPARQPPKNQGTGRGPAGAQRFWLHRRLFSLCRSGRSQPCDDRRFGCSRA